jgi:Sec-independent protein translocase protein TatA
MRIGLAELLVIVIVAVALIKPDKLKDLAKTISKALLIIKEENEKIRKEVVEPVKDAVAPITEPVKEAVQPVQDLQNEVIDTVTDIKKEVSPKINLEK